MGDSVRVLTAGYLERRDIQEISLRGDRTSRQEAS